MLRTPDAAMRYSAAHVHSGYPWQVFLRWRLQSQEGPVPAASSLSKTCRYCVTTCWSDCKKFRAHLTRTCPERTYGHLLQLPLQDLLRTRDGRVGAGGGPADPARTSTEGATPTTPPGEVIEPHATTEHSRVSRAAPRAGPATAARMCEPAGPSSGLGKSGQLVQSRSLLDLPSPSGADTYAPGSKEVLKW